MHPVVVRLQRGAVGFVVRLGNASRMLVAPTHSRRPPQVRPPGAGAPATGEWGGFSISPTWQWFLSPPLHPQDCGRWC